MLFFYLLKDQNQPSQGYLIDERVTGLVKWYNFKNGFGFVTR
jgi:hypothetical protein